MSAKLCVIFSKLSACVRLSTGVETMFDESVTNACPPAAHGLPPAQHARSLSGWPDAKGWNNGSRLQD